MARVRVVHHDDAAEETEPHLMITIVHGNEEKIRSECLRLFADEEHGLWIEEPIGIRRYWSGFRLLLPQLRAHLGDEAVDATLRRHRVVASLVLGGLRHELSHGEREDLHRLSARLTSHLSHNWYLDRPVLQGLARILRELLSLRSFKIFLPNICCPDPTTLALLLSVHRSMPDQPPSMVLGFDPSTNNEVIDSNGLTWGYSAEAAGNRFRAAQSLLDRMEIHTPTELPPPSKTLEVPAFQPDSWDDDPDGWAFGRLASSDPLGAEEVQTLITAAHRCFEAFGRDVAIVLCLKLLERSPMLSSAQAALIHEIIALSGHNWQFESLQGNARLTEFLEDHIRQALELETDQGMRLALLYRLAVTLGRRKKDFKAAMEVANRAIAEAQTAEVPPKERLYQEVWARNIRAYIHMRLKDLDSAFVDSDTCLKLVTKLTTPFEKAPRDHKFTRTAIADNNLTLCRIVGDEERLYERMQANIALLEEDPESFGGRFSAASWIFLYRKRNRLDLAAKAARYGLEDAGNTYISFRWYYLSQLGDLSYRLGDASKAATFFEQAEPLRPHIKQIHQRSSLALPVAASQARRLELAVAGFRNALVENESPSTRADIQAAWALALARCGLSEEAESRINEAIDLALEEGIRDTLLSVARNAGLVAQLSGRQDEALQAYQQGLEIAQVEPGSEPPVGVLAGILIGLAELDQDPGLILQALPLVARSLRDDSEIWWDLPRFLPLLGSWLSRESDTDLSDHHDALHAVVSAAYQRRDCHPGLTPITSLLPIAIHERSLEL